MDDATSRGLPVTLPLNEAHYCNISWSIIRSKDIAGPSKMLIQNTIAFSSIRHDASSRDFHFTIKVFAQETIRISSSRELVKDL